MDGVGSRIAGHVLGSIPGLNLKCASNGCQYVSYWSRSTAAGDNTDRVRNERAFAKLCGVCPIPAGSGRTNGRHRLNRGGNRQANAALHRTAIVRMHWHPEMIAAPRVSRRKRSSAVSSATSPESSTQLRRRAIFRSSRNDLTRHRSINALAETTNGLYKTECVRAEGPWRGVNDVELATLSWVHWYNETRLHSAIGYVPPAAYEAAHYRSINPRQQPPSGQPALH
jgi:transposase